MRRHAIGEAGHPGAFWDKARGDGDERSSAWGGLSQGMAIPIEPSQADERPDGAAVEWRRRLIPNSI
jgi:hypothetical protein